jgi:putative phosphoesterase
MQIAILADIHGNDIAFEAAVNDATAHGVDQFVCLGDVAALGPQPREVLERLRALQIPTVMGNTDDWLLNPEPWEIVEKPGQDTEEARRMLVVELWSAAQLTDADRDFIRTFRPTLTIELGDEASLLCFHGSPRHYSDVILATTAEEKLDEWFTGHRATVLTGGHAHAAMLRRYQDMVLINPGSVGLPYLDLPSERMINPVWAEYAILGWEDGRLSVDFRRVPYGREALIEAIFASGMPHADWWASEWV